MRRSAYFFAIAFIWIGLSFGCAVNSTVQKAKWEPWKPGVLDITHIHTGRGDAMFTIFPDGTTLIFDVGELDAEGSQARYYPLRIGPRVRPDLRAGEHVAAVIEALLPKSHQTHIDYALISHFHADHYGFISTSSPLSEQGPYQLSGITDLAEAFHIRKLIDRGAPDYNLPIDLATYYSRYDRTFANYLSFVSTRLNQGLSVEPLLVGDKDQITATRDPNAYSDFFVRNLAANGNIWTGTDDTTRQHIPQSELVRDNRFNGNPLSLAIQFHYGKFDYFTGGDLTGLQGFGQPVWFDLETPLAEVIGEVDVITLNHHGNRDATNTNFLKHTKPRILIQQSWVSDQPGGEVVHRINAQSIYQGPRDVFATYLNDATATAIGPSINQHYQPQRGHIHVRVHEGGEHYEVFVLDPYYIEPTIISAHGPYYSK